MMHHSSCKDFALGLMRSWSRSGHSERSEVCQAADLWKSSSVIRRKVQTCPVRSSSWKMNMRVMESSTMPVGEVSSQKSSGVAAVVTRQHHALLTTPRANQKESVGRDDDLLAFS